MNSTKESLVKAIAKSALQTAIAFPIIFGMFHFFILSIWLYWDFAPEIPLILSSLILLLCYWRMESFVPYPLHNRNNKSTSRIQKFIELPFWYVVMVGLYVYLDHMFNFKNRLETQDIYKPVLWGYGAFFALCIIGPLLSHSAITIIKGVVKSAQEIKNLMARVLSVFYAYMAVAIVFSALYRLLEHNNQKSFSASFGSWFDAIYFSFVTITTVGYGDIYPVTMPAKIMVVLEVLLGLLFLVIMLATAISISFHESVITSPKDE
ncbi:potassium channel family protein [Pseudomonas fluorescens group sp.]|uniref:Ion channel n=2 Tax=Pseudomonas fluorescens TaxID=294 RepID=A0ACD4XQW7_PSEFL|nr:MULTISPECIES: potassium channel family protein [Pseudomonas fluorescens group]MBZ6459142.1 potassium channel family protein [Pseudomonas fluorescens group sp.]MBZ6464394.1 potassium channel family protein [Pseudomonas fluorescens group sp.]MBZ6471345.1 potassium channel family protein [Pseudomonas fluorescens group sp.]WQD71357.1 ion channel [Pseudomonas marginalis]